LLIINKKYEKLITDDSRYFIVTGGRGSGKSFSINTFLCLLMLEDNQKILFLRKTLTSAYLSIIPEFQEKIQLLGLEDIFEVTKTEIINKTNKNSILFRGIQTGSKDNTANLKSLQGINTLVIDEAEEVTDETTFDRIDLSVRQKGAKNRVILIMNPSTKEHWIYKRYFEGYGVNAGDTLKKANTTYIHSTYLDNKENLDESFIYQVEDLKVKNPIKYNHVILGGWLDKAEGVIFNNWKLGTFNDELIPIFGQDFGFSIDPTTLIKTAIDKDLKIIYVKECYCRPKLTTSEIASLNKNFAGQALIYADSAEPRLINEVREYGLNIKEAVKGQGSITAGIAVLLDYQLVIDHDSINVIKELNNYVWSDKKSNTPIDAFNHCLDSLRYAVYSQITDRNKFFTF
jgi:phage terminase large subunit